MAPGPPPMAAIFVAAAMSNHARAEWFAKPTRLGAIIAGPEAAKFKKRLS